VHRYSYAPPADGGTEAHPALDGTPFQITIARNYARMLREIKRWQPDGGEGSRYGAVLGDDPEQERAFERRVLALLGPLAAGAVGWTAGSVRRTDGGLQILWQQDGLPPLTMVILPLAIEPRVLVRGRRFGLSAMSLLDRPYPLDAGVRRLFAAVALRSDAAEPRWLDVTAPPA
jgi:hypothetical protein